VPDSLLHHPRGQLYDLNLPRGVVFAEIALEAVIAQTLRVHVQGEFCAPCRQARQERRVLLGAFRREEKGGLIAMR